MTLLVLFALVAGAGTAVSPCVLPVLPAVLSAGVTGGRRRPLGVVSGLAISFTFATVALVYVIDALVMGSPDGPRPVRVLLDGHPVPDSLAGEDVHNAEAVVSAQRLYRLVDLPRAGRHLLSLRFAPGVAGYAFTFG